MNDLGTHTSHFNELFSEWKIERKIKVTKIFQDNPLQEVFYDSEDVYYTTTKLPHLDFIVQHTLMLERQTGHESRIINKFGNYYRTLEWSEVRELTWKGRKLFLETHPMYMVRPGEVAFDEDTRVPTFVHPQQAAPSLSDWTTRRGPTPMPPWREARDQTFVNPGGVEHRPPLRERDAWQRDPPLEARPPRRGI